MTMPHTHHNDIEEKVDDLLRSPLGCAFLAIIDESEIHPAVAAVPEISMQAAAIAIDETYIWSAIHEEIMEYLPRQRERLEGLARAILQDPKTDWWFAPLNRQSQAWVSGHYAKTLSSEKFVPLSPMRKSPIGDRSSQKVFGGGLYTSTLVKGASSWKALLNEDFHSIRSRKGTAPIPHYRLNACESAHIYEIRSPLDWHRLCVNYPAICFPNANDYGRQLDKIYPLKPTSKGTNEFKLGNWLTPDWHAVSNDYDAIHLTFGGLLTSDKVRVESDEGWSMNRIWDAEQTLWFRWMFESIERLPDYAPTERPFELSFPSLLSLNTGAPLRCETGPDDRRTPSTLSAHRNKV